jgi:undecaprenyl-diphosphatase
MNFSQNNLLSRKEFLTYYQSRLLKHHQLLWQLLILAITFSIFSVLAFSIQESPHGLKVDIFLLQKIHSHSQASLDFLATQLTDLGVFRGVFPIALIVSGFLVFSQKWRSLSYFLLAIISSALICRMAKIIFQRPRPHVWELLYTPSDYSFPSGHAMSSMTLAIALIIISWQTSWRWLTLLTGGIYVLFIGWTRLYLGVHYPTDVLGGWMLSISWAIIIYIILDKLNWLFTSRHIQQITKFWQKNHHD